MIQATGRRLQCAGRIISKLMMRCIKKGITLGTIGRYNLPFPASAQLEVARAVANNFARPQGMPSSCLLGSWNACQLLAV